ncbi:MAG TPA: VWA domain-containing protein [Pseudolysinimonas sp.]|nr:VWA domain-containing protein [Pseudolysinimonas sp.]
MELVFVWLPLVLAAFLVALLAVFVFLRRKRTRADADTVAAAHTDRFLRLPEYRRVYRRVILQSSAMFVLAVVSLGAFAVVAARPITTDVADTERVSRDIVLCLDVSGSMTSTDAKIIDRFQELVRQFQGERIALVVWDSSAAQVFPLTDDYPYVQQELAAIGDDTGVDIGDLGDLFGGGGESKVPLYAGTGLGEGSSLIGDGLASCVLRFDIPELDRSRTVILATDNQLAGTPLIGLDKAVDFAIEQKVRVYGIAPGGLLAGPELDELEAETKRTGGDLFSLGDVDGGQSIVDKVLDDQATALNGVPELIITDHPGFPFVVGVLALWSVVFVGWRLRS